MDQKPREMKVRFDAKSDVMYFSFGDPKEAISVETETGLIVRMDPDTDEVVGLTIVDFLKRLSGKDETLTVPIGNQSALLAG
jgi:uncharacterized protein YuzE